MSMPAFRLLLAGACCLLLSTTAVARDYLDARWNPIHFKPAISKASDAQCLECHQEIIERKVRATSPAGVAQQDTLAWYQTLTTYTGAKQETFHRSHMQGEYASQVMDLKCNTCHQGNDPREETANSSATGDHTLTQRKMVDPNICLMCHGQFEFKNMGLPGHWNEFGKIFNNSCLTCHAAIRTNRHQVNFLKADNIEKLGANNADVCFGCHGGRAWYRIAYPYPRNAWKGMPDTPEWARNRPTESDPRFRIPLKTTAKQTPAK